MPSPFVAQDARRRLRCDPHLVAETADEGPMTQARLVDELGDAGGPRAGTEPAPGVGDLGRRVGAAPGQPGREQLVEEGEAKLPAPGGAEPRPPVAGPEVAEVDDTAGMLAEFVKRRAEEGIESEGAEAHRDPVLATGVSGEGRAIADPARRRRNHGSADCMCRRRGASGLLGHGQ